MEYISAKEAAEKWNISKRRVQILCSENRINGAAKIGIIWAVPKDAEKPIDERLKKYKHKL
jgi:hypothetical protein